MSGQQERDATALSGLPDPLESTLIMARPSGGGGEHADAGPVRAAPAHGGQVQAGPAGGGPVNGDHANGHHAPSDASDGRSSTQGWPPDAGGAAEPAPHRRTGPARSEPGAGRHRSMPGPPGASPEAGPAAEPAEAGQQAAERALPRAALAPVVAADRSPAAPSAEAKPAAAGLASPADADTAGAPAGSALAERAAVGSVSAERAAAGGASAEPAAAGSASAEGAPRAEPAAQAQAGGHAPRPVPGSRADLRQRLELLPYGHPSSPYHSDGERKPPPPRLRHLELAPPMREIAARPDRAPAPDRVRGDDDRWIPTDAGQPGPLTADGPAAALPENAGPAITLPGDAGPAVTLPGHDGPGAALPADAGPAAALPADAGSPGGPPEPPGERASRPAGNGYGQGPQHPAVPGWPERGSAGSAMPETVTTGPTGPPEHGGEERAAVPQPQPALPRLAPDGSWSWGQASLTRDQVRIAEDAYDRFRAAEGRSLFGGYGGSGLTATMHRIAGQRERASLAPDTEQHALLEPDVFRARFADMLRRHPDRAPEQLVRRVPGALGYVFLFDPQDYTDGILDVQEALEIQGFQLQARRNSWSTEANRCVITIWRDPLSDLPFQVQFHTAASLEAQRLARTSTALINDPRIPPAEAANLRADLASAWAALPAPPGNADIADYRRASGTGRR